MRRGFVLHHNGPPAKCVGQPHTRCVRFWEAVHRYHTVTKGWSDIAYSFGVCPHGHRFTGRGWTQRQWANGADQVGANDGGDAYWYTVLAFVGGGAYGGFTTDAPEEQVTVEMQRGIVELIAEGRMSGRCGDRVLPHNRFKPKACPGPTLTGLAVELDGQAPITEDDDMTPEQEETLNTILIEQRKLRGEMDRQYGELSSRIDGTVSKARTSIYAARDSVVRVLRELHGAG